MPAGDNVVRLLPPLTVTDDDIRDGARPHPRRGEGRVGLADARRELIGSMAVTAIRHFTDLSAVPATDLRAMLDDAAARKARLKAGERSRPLDGKVLAMIFDKPSTRTRVSFDVGMRQLGGETIMLTGTEMQLGRSRDDRRHRQGAVALCRRDHDPHHRSHDRLLELTEHATVPVINGLTDDTHPCQLMADVMTFEEHRGPVAGKTFAWTGDGNNVLHSLLEASARFAFNLQHRRARRQRAGRAVRRLGARQWRRRPLDAIAAGGRRTTPTAW